MKRKGILTIIVLFVTALWLRAQTVEHIVSRGETLQTIAAQYGTTPERIIQLNPEAAQLLYVGMKLAVPTNTEASTLSLSNETVRIDSVPKDNKSHNESAVSPKTIDGGVGLVYRNGFDSPLKYGVYGLTSTMLIPQRIGYDFSITTNFSSDYVPTTIQIGPNYSFKLGDNVFLSVPASLAVSIYSNEQKDLLGIENNLVFSGLNCGPFLLINLGDFLCLDIGMDINIPFTGSTSVGWGYHLAILYRVEP